MALTPTATYPITAAWQRAKRRVELHAYQRGCLGFGGVGAPGTTATVLLAEFTAWLSMQGILTRKDNL